MSIQSPDFLLWTDQNRSVQLSITYGHVDDYGTLQRIFLKHRDLRE